MKKPYSLPALTKITPLLISGLSFFYIPVFAQGSFQKAYGVEGFEKGTAVRQLSDGYIIGGETQSYGLPETDMLLTRTDANGNIKWTKSFGGPEREVITDVVQVPDGGFIFLGERYLPDKKEGEFLTLGKTDAGGTLLWKKIFDEGGNETEGFSMTPTPDGNYIITGVTRKLNIVSTAFFNVTDRNPRLYLLKVDGSGNTIWSRYLKLPDAQISTTGNSVIIARDGSYMITGNITSKAGSEDDKSDEARNMLLVKVKADGTLVWAKEYAANRVTAGFRIIEKKTGGFMIAGIATPDKTNNVDYCLVNTDADGNLLWSQTVGGPKFDAISDVAEADDGSFVFSGSTNSFGAGASDILMFKVDANSNLLWAKTYGTESGEYAGQMVRSGSGFALTGQVSMGKESYDVLLLKTDPQGISGCWGKSLFISLKPFALTTKTIANASTAGIEPTNLQYRKPDANRIVPQSRTPRAKNICQ